MKLPLFTPKELVDKGFAEQPGETLDIGYYRWWKLDKNDCTLIITYEYNPQHQCTCHGVEFNGEALLGRQITRNDITFLISLM